MFAAKNELFTTPSGGYTISRSVRLRSSASAYLNRTAGTPTSGSIFTHSFWFKRGALGAGTTLISGQRPTNFDRIYIQSNDALLYQWNDGTSNLAYVETTQVFRDPSAWYHILIATDTTQATASNRVKIYVNGTQVTALTSTTYPSQNSTSYFNTNAVTLNIGRSTNATFYLDGYLTEINFIDGQALTPSSFGTTNATTGVWQPAKYTGTYGTNGFYLNFSDNSSNTATTIGKDYSGNGNNWTPNNISVTSGSTYDSMLDVPTPYADGGNGRGNYCVGNPLDNSGTLSSGNLTFVSGGSNQSNRATFQLPSSGKFYAECTLGTTTSASVGEAFGYATASASLTGTPNSSGKYVIYADSTGGIYSNGSTLTSSLGTFASGTVLQIAYDGTTGNAWVGKNNTWYNSSGGTTGDPSAGSNPTFTSLSSVFPFTQGINATQNLNFGQQPFTYTPPTGYVALNTYNLPASTITNGAAYMAATTYTGNGTSQSINNSVNGVSFQPDFVWYKDRSVARDHALFDVTRGALDLLSSNTTGAASSVAGTLTSFNSNGYSIGSTANANANGETYVGWQWKAGGTGSSNTNGSITSTVSVGATQGFSVVTYTATAATGTIGHGLGVAPSMIITARRSSGGAYWGVYHQSLGASQTLYMQVTNAATADLTTWNATSPTSSVFSVGNSAQSNNPASATYVAYCFAAVKGFSAFGSYTGNGSADGAFVYLGFRPRFVLFKRTDTTNNWLIIDSVRGPYNSDQNRLFPNLSNAEDTSENFDLLSNGFKLRDAAGSQNASGGTYIYAAFAENPFKNALAR